MSHSRKNTNINPITRRPVAPEDPVAIRAAIAVLRQKIAGKAASEPKKSAVVLTEWVQKSVPTKKSA